MTEESDKFAKEEKLEIEGLSDFEFASPYKIKKLKHRNSHNFPGS